jgi:hypothetical protein
MDPPLIKELREIGRGAYSIVYYSGSVPDTVVKVYNHCLRMHDGNIRQLSNEERQFMFEAKNTKRPETLSKEEYKRMMLYYMIYTEELRFLERLRNCTNVIQLNDGLRDAIKECRLLGIGLDRMDKPLSKINLRTVPTSFRRRLVCSFIV